MNGYPLAQPSEQRIAERGRRERFRPRLFGCRGDRRGVHEAEVRLQLVLRLHVRAPLERDRTVEDFHRLIVLGTKWVLVAQAGECCHLGLHDPAAGMTLENYRSDSGVSPSVSTTRFGWKVELVVAA
jgi:hypothetical protein